jgi:hypothetical protein
MTREQAGWCSWEEFLMRRDGKIQEERLAWERARWEKFIDLQLQPFIKAGHKPKSPQQWMQFEWEKKDKAKQKQPPKRLHTTTREQEILQDIFSKLK